jgi:cell wall-associated NlpC family hydrolase
MAGFKLPRRSAEQATKGKKIDVSDAKPGDLLFFLPQKAEKSHIKES